MIFPMGQKTRNKWDEHQEYLLVTRDHALDELQKKEQVDSNDLEQGVLTVGHCERGNPQTRHCKLSTTLKM